MEWISGSRPSGLRSGCALPAPGRTRPAPAEALRCPESPDNLHTEGTTAVPGPDPRRPGAAAYNSPHLYGRSYSRLRSPSASGGGPLPRASRTWMAQFSRSRCHGTGRRLPSRVIRCRVLTGRQHVVAGAARRQPPPSERRER